MRFKFRVYLVFSYEVCGFGFENARALLLDTHAA